MSTPAGLYRVTLFADSENKSAEYSETNNPLDAHEAFAMGCADGPATAATPSPPRRRPRLPRRHPTS